MKKNTLNKILLTLILLLTTYNVSASTVIDALGGRYDSSSPKIVLSCKYKDEENNVFRYNLYSDQRIELLDNGQEPEEQYGLRLNFYQLVTLGTIIDLKVDKYKLHREDGNGLYSLDVGGFAQQMVRTGQCPKYAIEYRKNSIVDDVKGDTSTYYAAALDLAEISIKYDTMKTYTLEKTEYNYDTFCFYDFVAKDKNGNDTSVPRYLSIDKNLFWIDNDRNGLHLNEFIPKSNNEKGEFYVNKCNTENNTNLCGLATLKTDIANESNLKYLEHGCPRYISSAYNSDNFTSGVYNFMQESSAKNYYSKIMEHDLTEVFEEPKLDENVHLICSDILDKEMLEWINTGIFIIQILAILIIIVLTVKEYAFVILNSDQENMKKNNKNLIKRITLLIILFLIPALIKFTFKIIKIDIVDSKDPLCQNVNK